MVESISLVVWSREIPTTPAAYGGDVSHPGVRRRCLMSCACRHQGCIMLCGCSACQGGRWYSMRLRAVGGRLVAGSCVCHVVLRPGTDRPPVLAGGGWLAQLGGERACWPAVVYGWSFCGAGGWMPVGVGACAVLRWLAVARVDRGVVIGCRLVDARRPRWPPVGLVFWCDVVGLLALGVVLGLVCQG